MKRFNKFLIAALVFAFMFGLVGSASAATTTVDPGSADSFAILAGTAVTNVPTSVITGNLGLSPAAGTFYDSGVTQAQVTGTIYSVNAAGPSGYVENKALVDQAQLDLTTAYIDAAGRTPTTTFSPIHDLGGATLMSGVYNDPSSLGITGTLTLDAQGDPNAVWIFQAGSTLITEASSKVALINGAQACNVFWQVGSSATLKTSSIFKGTILALTSITIQADANVNGRMLARNGAVTLDSDTITAQNCSATVAAASAEAATYNTTKAAADAATAATATAQAAALATTKLPSTGVAPSQNSASRNIAILVGIFTVSTLFIAIQRKKRAI